MPVPSEKIPLTTHCEASVTLPSLLAEIQNRHSVVPDLKQKHKQVSGFQGSKALCLSLTGDPCSTLGSLLLSQGGNLPVVSRCPALHLGIKPDPLNANRAPIVVDKDWPPVGILRAASRWEKSPQYLSSKAKHSLQQWQKLWHLFVQQSVCRDQALAPQIPLSVCPAFDESTTAQPCSEIPLQPF